LDFLPVNSVTAIPNRKPHLLGDKRRPAAAGRDSLDLVVSRREWFSYIYDLLLIIDGNGLDWLSVYVDTCDGNR
jgi:hypothetical protein